MWISVFIPFFFILYLSHLHIGKVDGYVTHLRYGSEAISRPLVRPKFYRRIVIPDLKHSFKRSGTIHHWTFYAKSGGTLYLQIWRKTYGHLYRLIARDYYYVRRLGLQRIRPSSNRAVVPGDVIGFFSPRKGIIPYTEGPCTKNQTTIYAMISSSVVYRGSERYFNSVDLRRNVCRSYSLNALVTTKEKKTGLSDQEYGSDSIYRFDLSNRRRTVYISNSEDKVVRDGYVVRWQLYARRIGRIYLQIWKNINSSRYRLLNQTTLYLTKIGFNTIIPKEPFIVEKDSVMGFFCPNSNMIPYETSYCYRKRTFRAILSSSIGTYGEYDFKSETRCREHSIKMLLTKDNQILKDYGNAAQNRAYRDLTKNAILIPRPDLVLPNGRLWLWQIYTSAKGRIDLQIWRPKRKVGVKYVYTLVSQTTVDVTNPGLMKVSLDSGFPVQNGDVIGFYHRGENIIPFNGVPCPKPEYMIIEEPETDDINVGSDATFTERDVVWNKCRAYSVSARVQEDITEDIAVDTTASYTTNQVTYSPNVTSHTSTAAEVTIDDIVGGTTGSYRTQGETNPPNVTLSPSESVGVY